MKCNVSKIIFRESRYYRVNIARYVTDDKVEK